MSEKAKVNFAVDAVIAAAFLLSAMSGIVMLLTRGDAIPTTAERSCRWVTSNGATCTRGPAW